ncbi:hypothetical protein [Oerskovia sp. KBS0722]|nr:hypothetical protein [Oerskovia sp. KBS0722]
MSDPYWNHSTHYFPVLTRLVGPGTRSALDVGCGACATWSPPAGRSPSWD